MTLQQTIETPASEGRAPGQNVPRANGGLRRWLRSLGARLFAIAAFFILLAEALVFIPSLVTLRHTWLEQRVATAELAVLASKAESAWTNDASAGALMQSAGISSVVEVTGTGRRLLLGTLPPPGLRPVSLETETLGQAIQASLGALFIPGPDWIAIETRASSNATVRLEVVVAAKPLRETKVREAWRVLFGSFAIATLVGMFLLIALFDGLVLPMRRLTDAIIRFRNRPEDLNAAIRPSGRTDEIGEAEEALAGMQSALRDALLQQQRLAQMGMSVSKISHDLRHSLGSAQLVSERLETVDDPVVQRSLPRLQRALERAAALAESTLRYGRAEERAPEPDAIELLSLAEDVADAALAGITGVTLVPDCPEPALAVRADRDHLLRIATNLIRNAALAIAGTGKPGSVKVSGSRVRDSVIVRFIDDGPGISPRVQENLFKPWSSGGASGGTGLGLAIARELAVANGGTLVLESTGPQGTVFHLTLPGA